MGGDNKDECGPFSKEDPALVPLHDWDQANGACHGAGRGWEFTKSGETAAKQKSEEDRRDKLTLYRMHRGTEVLEGEEWEVWHS